jgi:hypothetical protein
VRFLCVTLALTGALLGGCGGGDDRPQVEDSLQDYLGTVNPERSSFPVGAGIPRVRPNACKDGHVRVPKGRLLSDGAGIWKTTFPEEVALWSCVVTFGDLPQQATVAVTASTKVVWAVALPLDAFPVSEVAHTHASITCRWPRTTPDGAAIC